MRVPPGPLCPVVLSLLAARPLAVHEVAGELGRRALARPGDYPAARMAVQRLRAAGLVRATGAARPVYRLTARGRRELALQRVVWARVAELSCGKAGPSAMCQAAVDPSTGRAARGTRSTGP